MNAYLILRHSGWSSPAELQQAAARSRNAGANMADEGRRVRSYVMSENSGRRGTVCIYQGSRPEAIRRRGDIAFLPVDEIVPVMEAAINRPDPA